MPIAEDSAGGSPVPIPTNLTTNLTGEATGSGTLDYTTGDIDIAVTVVDNGHNHILENITDVQVNNAISGQILVYNGTVWANATNTSGITAIVQDTSPQLGGNLDLNNRNINGNGNINLADNYKLTLGTGNDLEISHDGVSSYIRDVGAGDLQIFASDDVYIRGQGSNTYMARFNESGAVTLYHNNVIRLITTDSGITVTDEVEAAEFIGPLRGPTKFKGQAGEALSAGDPVYISGISGNTTVVSKADANDASKMPAFGIIDASVSANATCQVLTFGEMHNLDTSAFSEGDELYVSNTGTLTTAIPSGESSQIQKIAKVTRSHASAGGIFIMGAGRSNAVPNLDNGDIFIGDGTNHATTTSLNTAVNALTLTNYLPLSGGAMTGNITTSGTFDGRDVSVDGAKLDGIATGADVTLNEISAGTNVTISAGGVISSTASGGLAHVVDDTTPQLGGNLDLNSNDITGTGNLNFTGSVTLSGTVDGRDVAADGTKLDGIEASADVTDTANVTAAGALMDSEVTNLAQVKAFDSSDYATAAQGTTADAALPKAGGTMTGALTVQADATFTGGGTGSIVINDEDSSLCPTMTFLRNGGGTTTNDFIKFENSGGEVANIDSTGGALFRELKVSGSNTRRLDISNTTLADAGEMATFQWDNNANLTIQGRTSVGGFAANWYSIQTTDTDGRADAHIFYTDASTERMRIDSGGIDVTGTVVADKMFVEGTANSRQWEAGSAGQKLAIYAYDNSTFYHRLETGNATNYQWGTYDNIPIYTITNNSIKTTLLANGNFGVGLTAPTAKMHLFTDGIDQSMFSAQADLGVQNRILTLKSPVSDSSSQPFRWQTSNSILWEIDTTETKSMLLNSAGDLGVGTYSPSSKLSVAGDILLDSDNAEINLKSGITGTSGAVNWTFNTTTTNYASLNLNYDTRATTGFHIDSGYPITIDSSGIGTIFAYGGTEQMRLTNTGRLGIGTSSPAHELQIESTSPTIRMVDTDGSNALEITQSGSASYLTFDNNMRFRNASAVEKLRIDGNGIDVTGDLTVSSTIEVGSLTPNQDGAIEVGVIALGTPAISSTTDSTSLRNHIIFDNPNGAVGKINTLNSATSYLTSSDYRLKTDVQEMTGSIDRVKALRPVNFEWVVDGTRVDGFLAHEAQEVVPEAVDGEKDAMRDQQYVESEATGDIYTPAVDATYETIQVELTPAVEATYDEDGNELTPAVDATYEEQQQELTPAVDEVIHSSDVVEPDELEEGQLWRETTEKVMATRQVPDYQGIDQSKIVPLLTSALQDAIAKIEALETRLEALES